ncbi:hypothetical protein [Cupriavidus plantarum]|uniref:hypothetical protein n=1 Tax=Cupriavidus plantarum TaxID=942865 RepID=UPI00339D8D54
MEQSLSIKTETTFEGLATLTRHVVAGSIKGELHPGFVWSIAKRIAKEYDAMLRYERNGEDLGEVVAATDMLRGIIASHEGKTLSSALSRLRPSDAGGVEKPNI